MILTFSLSELLSSALFVLLLLDFELFFEFFCMCAFEFYDISFFRILNP